MKSTKQSNTLQWRIPKKKRVSTQNKIGFCHCACVLKKQVMKMCTDLDHGLLYILIFGTYSKFTRKNNFLALSVCFPQPCSSAGRRFAASRSHVQNYQRNDLFPKKIDEMRCKLDSTENLRSFGQFPAQKC